MSSQDKENNKEDTNQKHAQSHQMNECRFPLSKSPETGVSETQGKQVIVTTLEPSASSAIGSFCEIRMLPGQASRAATSDARMPSNAKSAQQEGHPQSNAVASALGCANPVNHGTAQRQAVSVPDIPITNCNYTSVNDQCDWLNIGGNSSPITVDSSNDSCHTDTDNILHLFHDFQIDDGHGAHGHEAPEVGGSVTTQSMSDSNQTNERGGVSTPASSKSRRHFDDLTPRKVKLGKGSNSQVNSPAEAHRVIVAIGSHTNDEDASSVSSPPHTPTGKLFPSSPDSGVADRYTSSYSYAHEDLLHLPTTIPSPTPSNTKMDPHEPYSETVPKSPSPPRLGGHRQGSGRRHHAQGYSRGSHPHPDRHLDIAILNDCAKQMRMSGISWHSASAKNEVTAGILTTLLKSNIPQDSDLPFDQYLTILLWALYRIDPNVHSVYGRYIWDKEMSSFNQFRLLKEGGIARGSSQSTPPITPVQGPPSVKVVRQAQRGSSMSSVDSSKIESSMESRERDQRAKLVASLHRDSDKTVRIAEFNRHMRQQVFHADRRPLTSSRQLEEEDVEDCPPPTYDSDEEGVSDSGPNCATKIKK
jgi:hypothetical protein